jgi:hypothetical protein
MSVLTKLLPIAALGVVGAMNSSALKGNIDIIRKAKVAATSGIEMRGIADTVAAEYNKDKRLPLLDFSNFLKENMVEKGGGKSRDTSKDMWEMPYRIVLDVEKNAFQIWSAGPDKTWVNDDDLKYLYVLTGLGGEDAISMRQKQEWTVVVTRYKQENARQQSGKDGSTALAQSPSKTAKKPGLGSASATDIKKFESQKARAERGSANAKLDLAERYAKGDNVVKKDLAQAKEYLEQAVNELDSETYRRKATDLLAKVKAQMGN